MDLCVVEYRTDTIYDIMQKHNRRSKDATINIFVGRTIIRTA